MRDRITKMDMIPPEIGHIAKILGAAATLLTILWKVGYPVFKWLKNWAKTGSRIAEMNDLINMQLKPNGTPMHEKVASIHKSVQIHEARQKLDFENSDTPSYEFDPNGQCVTANPALCKLFGIPEDKMLGQGWLIAIENAEERQRVWDNWMTAIETRVPYRETYLIRNQKTNELIECVSTTITCASKEGEPLLYIGVIRRKDS